MGERPDEGAVLAQERVPIRADDTVHTLVRRTKVEVGARLLVETIALLEQGAARPRAIDPPPAATSPTRTPTRSGASGPAGAGSSDAGRPARGPP